MHRWIPLALLLAACAGEEADEAAAPGPPEDSHVHHHAARYGGTLVELGEHAAQVEIVLDAASGTIIAYIWDGCVEEPIRTDMTSLRIDIATGRDPVELKLLPVADPFTGEKPGDSARFQATAAILKGATAFSGILGEVKLRGKTYAGKAFEFHGQEEDE